MATKKIADKIIKSTCVFTANTLEPKAAAVLISGNEIAGVVEPHEVDAYVGPDTQLYDCGDRTVLPGFNDAHTHFIQNGVMKDADYTLSLEGARTKEEVCERIREFVQSHPDNAWIAGCDLNYSEWEDGEEPTKELLDELVPDRPAYFASWDMHVGWVNSLALESIGYKPETKDPEGGFIGRNEDGSLKGLNYEPPANDPVWGMANLAADMDRALGNVISECLSYGVTATGCVWPYGGISEEDTIRVFSEFEQSGKLPIRVSCFVKLEDGLANAHRFASELQGEHLRFAGTKLITDGICEGHTGYLTEPYADDPSTCGEPTVGYEKLLDLVAQADASGYGVRLHAIGNGAVKQALDVFEEVGTRQGFKGHRNAIEHIETCRPEDLERFAKLGVVASMQPIHSVLNVDGYPALLGEKWVPYMWPVRSLLDSKAVVAFGTDAPVWNLNPMEGVYAAMTRKQPWDGAPEDGFVPSQRISLAQALQAYTYGSAFVENFEHRIGALAEGKLADIVVMDRNLFAATPEEILEAKPAYTFIDGDVVFEAPGLDLCVE